MKGTRNIALIGIAVIVLILFVWGCNGYNAVVKKDTVVEKTWGDVNAEYQRRLDLVDNLVNTVKGAANFEKETLIAVQEARSKATSIQLNADQLTPENVAKFQQVQGELGSTFNRLMVSVERYPDLKAVTNFSKLQDQIEGIENNIRNARTTFNTAVTEYNLKVRSFPINMLAGMFGFERKGTFQAEAGAEKAPKVQF